MRTSIGLLAIFFSTVFAQTYPVCTAELVRTDDCAGVINANACYNKFRWNAQTLTCIEGKDDEEKKKRVRVREFRNCSTNNTTGMQMLCVRRHSDV